MMRFYVGGVCHRFAVEEYFRNFEELQIPLKEPSQGSKEDFKAAPYLLPPKETVDLAGVRLASIMQA